MRILWALQVPWLSLAFSMTLGWAVTFKHFQTFPLFSIFFDLKQFNKNRHWYPAKCVLFALFNYSSLNNIVLASSSTVTYLPDKTLIFHDFHGPKIKFHDFPGLENKILSFHDFPGFPWPARTLLPHFTVAQNRSIRCSTRRNISCRLMPVHRLNGKHWKIHRSPPFPSPVRDAQIPASCILWKQKEVFPCNRILSHKLLCPKRGKFLLLASTLRY